jgi:hypothetical protein
MRKSLNRRNTPWSDEQDKRLMTLLAQGESWASIAAELKRSYAAVEARAWKLNKRGSWTLASADDNAVVIYRPQSPRVQSMNLRCDTVNDTAMPLVSDLYDRAMTYRAATIAKSYSYQKSKPRLQRVIAAILRELLAARPQDSEPAWSNVSISRTRASEIGINEEILQNLLDGLEQHGLIERFTGYSGIALTSQEARRGRRTRIRGTLKLFDLCALYQITSENIRS